MSSKPKLLKLKINQAKPIAAIESIQYMYKITNLSSSLLLSF